MSNRPIHPRESGVPDSEWETDLAQVMYPATVVPDSTVMRPFADDYQPPGQGVQSFGYDNDVPTDNWEPDQDYNSQRTKQEPVPIGALFPAIDVRVMPHGLVRTTFRTVIGNQEPFVFSGAGARGVPYMPSVRQILSRDLNRQRAIIRATSIPNSLGVQSMLYGFALSADPNFNDFMPIGYTLPPAAASPEIVEIEGTDEVWCAIMLWASSYDPTKYNSLVLCVQWESIVTADSPEQLGK
jgi:hypothetical protein